MNGKKPAATSRLTEPTPQPAAERWRQHSPTLAAAFAAAVTDHVYDWAALADEWAAVSQLDRARHAALRGCVAAARELGAEFNGRLARNASAVALITCLRHVGAVDESTAEWLASFTRDEQLAASTLVILGHGEKPKGETPLPIAEQPTADSGHVDQFGHEPRDGEYLPEFVESAAR